MRTTIILRETTGALCVVIAGMLCAVSLLILPSTCGLLLAFILVIVRSAFLDKRLLSDERGLHHQVSAAPVFRSSGNPSRATQRQPSSLHLPLIDALRWWHAKGFQLIHKKRSADLTAN